MKLISQYIFEKLHLDKNIEVEDENNLSEEELNYKFKLIIAGSKDTPKEIIEDNEKKYNKSPEESAKKLKKLVKLDKFLVDNHFKRKDKASIKLFDINDIYFVKTDVNRNGNCVVYDPFMSINEKDEGENYVFLVGKCKNQMGKTINPIECVEPKEFAKENHDFYSQDINQTYFDDIEDAWAYITKKYGTF